MRALLKVFSLGFALSMLGACAGDVVDIDRTQANKIKKDIFVGEWYLRGTVLDVDFNQGQLFEGYEGTTERIKWDMEEDQLIAYRSYEMFVGAEQGDGSDEFYGTPVASFRIISHFDVIRRYNDATGEEGNVIIENMSDRPWYERDYIRVDWSRNLVNNPFALEVGVTAMSGAPYYVQEHEIDNPYRPEITDTNINIVLNYSLRPDIHYYPGYGYYGTCVDFFGDWTHCGSSNAKMKFSFMKVIDRDYAPMVHPDVEVLRVPEGYADSFAAELARDDDAADMSDEDHEYFQALEGQPIQECYANGECKKEYITVFERFGFFRHERRVYDEEFQWTRDGRIFLGHRWNIWKRTHDALGDVIPFAQRRTKAITYFTNVDFPTESNMFTAALEIGGDWNEILRNTVKSLRTIDMSGMPAEAVEDIFVVKANSCSVDSVNQYAADHGYKDALADYGIADVARGNIKRACAVLEYASDGDFTWEKVADLRNSYIHWVDTPMQSGPLGYGPSSADPVTGEIIAAVANVYGASLETYAAYAADVVQLMNGDMVEADLEMGTYIRDGIEESRKLANANLNLPGLNDLNVLHDRMSGGMPSDIGPQATQVNLDVMKDRRTYTIKPSTRDDFLSYMGRADSKMEKLKGSQMEKELLIDEEIRRSLLGPTGYQPGGMAEWDASEFSPLELMGEEQEKRSRAAFLQATEGTIMYPEAWEDSGMLSLADDLKGKSWEDIYTFMLERTFYSVTVHEVGHTIGLRHNFEGSMDPLNYHAEYWDSYNMTTGKIDKVDDLGNPTGAEQYMYSSIMDYLPRFYADDLQGPGPYDVAAIKFGYGELIEVFDDETAALGFGSLQWLHGHENIPKMVTGDVACTTTGNCPASYITASNYYDSFSIHYNRAEAAERAMYQSEEDGNGALADDYRQEMLKEYDIAFTEYEYYSGYLNDYFLEALEGVTAKPENIWARHDISYESLRDVWTTYYLWSYYGSHYDNPPDEVPYAFCPDEYANYTNPSCQLWDKGASFWEVTQDTKERYDSYYYFANFKRDKYTFSANGWGWFSRVYRRYFSGLSNMFIYSLYSDMNMGKDSDGNYLTLVDFPVGAEWLMAGVDGMNTLVSVVNQPEPGAHCLDSATNTYMHMEEGETCTSGDTIEVPLGVGKYFYSNWTDEYYYKPTRQGVFWEKLAAVYALTTNEGFFYRDFSSYFDAGANSFSYWNGGFKEELLDLFYDAMTGTTGNFAWRYTAPAGTVAAKYASAPIVEPVVGEFDYNKPKIESSSSRTLRYYNTFLPMIRYNSAFDYKEDFLNYTKICIEGYGDCYDFALNETFYTDRTTGYIYKTSDTDLADKSISRRLLQEAEDFATDVFDPAEAAYDACVADCDDERAVYQAAESDLIMNTQFIDQLRMMGDLVD